MVANGEPLSFHIFCVKYMEYLSDPLPYTYIGARTHIAFVKAGLQSKLYVNGRVDTVLRSSSIVQYLRQDLVIGADYRDGDAYLTGTMDTIKVFGNSLSDGDIVALYTVG